MRYYVYILTNKNHSTLYIGMTNNIALRTWTHKQKLENGFTDRYNTTKLVYVEEYNTPQEAIMREKAMKKWRRQWKENAINQTNPDWEDLYEKIHW